MVVRAALLHHKVGALAVAGRGQQRAALDIEKICFCREIKTFGVYDPWPEDHAFQAGVEDRPGELVQVYVELRNFTSGTASFSMEPSHYASVKEELAGIVETHETGRDARIALEKPISDLATSLRQAQEKQPDVTKLQRSGIFTYRRGYAVAH